MAKPPMVQKNFRIPTDLYAEAKAKADARLENLSDVVRDAFADYVKKDD